MLENPMQRSSTLALCGLLALAGVAAFGGALQPESAPMLSRLKVGQRVKLERAVSDGYNVNVLGDSHVKSFERADATYVPSTIIEIGRDFVVIDAGRGVTQTISAAAIHVITELPDARQPASARSDDWRPPAKPDPQAILREAHADGRAKRYDIALAKHEWFHANALSIEPSLSGVRLSFALSYWHELAKEYPPALTKLKEIRDRAKSNVMEGKEVFESFLELAAINRTLDEESITKDAFEALERENPKAAKQVFESAKPSLVRAKAYAVLGKYVEPKSDFARASQMYGQGKKLADDPRFGARHLEFANKSFANDTATLVAILAVNDRNKEAAEIAASARAEWDDGAFHASLEKALKGAFPDPWP
jgi:hypothetical protein